MAKGLSKIYLLSAVAVPVILGIYAAVQIDEVFTGREIGDQRTEELKNLRTDELADGEIQKPTAPITQTILFNVSFTAQAPFGEWQDPRQQNGCEEAAALMAVRWARGTSFNLEQARDEVIKISEWERQTYGLFEDTSARDTIERIFFGYFNYSNVRLAEDITAADIKSELAAGHLVVVPVNGRLLGNPFFTSPGPLEHMLVIKGYDPSTGEFITNDPGTRQGKDFRYQESVLESALQDYPTGFHEPILQVNKVMIVVS